MEAMYALSRGEALGQELRAVFPPEFVEAIDRFRNEPGVHHLYKFPLTTRAGEQRTANIAVAPLLSRDFVSVGRIILVDDITERVSLETQLAQADKLSSIGLLAAGVAHEINTPLAVISSYAQMLSKQLRAMRGSRRARQDYAAEFPRGGDRQWPAELFAHFDNGVPRDQFESSDSRHAFTAGASIQDGEDRSGYGTGRGFAARFMAIPGSCNRSS